MRIFSDDLNNYADGIDDSELMYGVFPEICFSCMYFLNVKKRQCSAFKNSPIPDEIWFGGNDHTKPYDGDNGVQYKKSELPPPAYRKEKQNLGGKEMNRPIWETIRENIVEVMRVLYDSNQPRDKEGKWTDGGVGEMLGLSSEDTSQINDLWEKELSPQLNKVFNEGSATCTIATGKVGKFLEDRGHKVSYVSGDFEDAGHWWPEVSVKRSDGSGMYDRFVVDLGNNIMDSAIETGKLTPVVAKSVGKGKDTRYKAEDRLTRAQFLKEMQGQGYKKSMFE